MNNRKGGERGGGEGVEPWSTVQDFFLSPYCVV